MTGYFPPDQHSASPGPQEPYRRALPAGPYGQRDADQYGQRDADPYGQPDADQYGQRDADRYGHYNAEPYGRRDAEQYGHYNAEPYGQRDADQYGHRGADQYGQHSVSSADSYGQQHALPAGPHRASHQQRRGMGTGMLVGLVVAVVVVLGGVGTAVALTIRSDAPPADAPTAAQGAPVTVKLGEKVPYRAGKITASYTLATGPELTLTPSGSRPSRGSFFALSASVAVTAGSVYLTDDNFVLVTKDGLRFEPDVSFLFDGGLRGARASAGQTAQGVVVWDVPPGSGTGAKVELRLDDDVRGTWQLP